MQVLHLVLWTSAACLLVCMALDGTFLDVRYTIRSAWSFAIATMRGFWPRALAVFLRLLAAVFRVGIDRMENGCFLSKVAWALLTYGIYHALRRPLSAAVEPYLDSRSSEDLWDCARDYDAVQK